MKIKQNTQKKTLDFLLKIVLHLVVGLIKGKKNKIETEATRPNKPPILLGTDRKIP